MNCGRKTKKKNINIETKNPILAVAEKKQFFLSVKKRYGKNNNDDGHLKVFISFGERERERDEEREMASGQKLVLLFQFTSKKKNQRMNFLNFIFSVQFSPSIISSINVKKGFFLKKN